jgi:hypothetical protein
MPEKTEPIRLLYLSDTLADEARFPGLTGVLAVVIVDTGLYC